MSKKVGYSAYYILFC